MYIKVGDLIETTEKEISFALNQVDRKISKIGVSLDVGHQLSSSLFQKLIFQKKRKEKTLRFVLWHRDSDFVTLYGIAFRSFINEPCLVDFIIASSQLLHIETLRWYRCLIRLWSEYCLVVYFIILSLLFDDFGLNCEYIFGQFLEAVLDFQNLFV